MTAKKCSTPNMASHVAIVTASDDGSCFTDDIGRKSDLRSGMVKQLQYFNRPLSSSKASPPSNGETGTGLCREYDTRGTMAYQEPFILQCIHMSEGRDAMMDGWGTR